MSKINKINQLSTLFDVYSKLLTDNQREVFVLYYLEDSSLSEIAEQLGVSKASVSDNLKKTEEKLLKYESKLKLSERNEKLNKLINKINDEQLQAKLREFL